MPQQTPHKLKQTVVISLPISLMPVNRKYTMNLTSQGYFKEESPSRYKKEISSLASIQDILFQYWRGIITRMLTCLGYPDRLPA